MLGPCCNKTYTALTNYKDGYDNEDDDVNDYWNEYGNNEDNATSASGFDGPIFDPITSPFYYGGGLSDNCNGAAAVEHYIYIHGTIYITSKHPIKYVP